LIKDWPFASLQFEGQYNLKEQSRLILRYFLAAFYLSAGVFHVIATDKFQLIVPQFVPFPHEVVIATGLCEIAGAIALLTERLRWWGGVMLALYAFCVWPANIKQAIEGISVPPIPDTWLYHGPRLAFQPVLIWMALFGAKVINWPFRPGVEVTKSSKEK
jgi:uncharacterized membrane protein